MIYTILSLLAAAASIIVAVLMYIERHDTEAQLKSLSSRVDSLQGSVGNLKQGVRRDAKKAVYEELEAMDIQPGGSSGMDQMMQQMMLSSMMGGGGAAGPGQQQAEPRGDGRPIVGDPRPKNGE